MMFTAQQPARRGQVLIVAAFAMFGLMAIGAIVIDLGFSWMLRRQEQNAADPGAIAAARYIEEATSPGDPGVQTNMNAAACFYAQENGFFDGDLNCADALSPLNRNLEVLWPPSGPHAGEFAGRPEMVLVVIRAEHPAFFARVFGQTTAEVATGAVAAQESKSANSNSLVALDPISCGAGKLHGNGTITIAPEDNPDTDEPYSGGYVHVNSSCDGGSFDNACGPGGGAFHQGGNNGPVITAPQIYIHGTCQASGGTVISPVIEGAPQIGDPLAQLVGPRQQDYFPGYCPKKGPGNTIIYEVSTPSSEGCTWSQQNTTVTMTPGVYYGGWTFSGKDVTVRLQAGIYIIAGGGISNSGADIDSMPASVGGDPDPEVDPARVLIFSTDNTTDTPCLADPELPRCLQGHIKFSGKSSLRMWGLDSGPWRGLMMWQDGDGNNPDAPIELVGQGSLDLAGTMYAPDANVKIEGNGEETGTLAIQIISWNWDVGGNGDLYMPYNPNQLYQIRQRGLVH